MLPRQLSGLLFSCRAAGLQEPCCVRFRRPAAVREACRCGMSGALDMSLAQARVETKELKLRPNTDTHDYDTKVGRRAGGRVRGGRREVIWLGGGGLREVGSATKAQACVTAPKTGWLCGSGVGGWPVKRGGQGLEPAGVRAGGLVVGQARRTGAKAALPCAAIPTSAPLQVPWRVPAGSSPSPLNPHIHCRAVLGLLRACRCARRRSSCPRATA